MSAARQTFWAKLDEQRVTSPSTHGQQPDPALAPRTAVAVSSRPSITPLPRPLAAQTDWSSVLDIISEAGEHAKQQETRLQEQAAGFQRTIQELHGEMQAIQQQVQASDARAQTIRTEAEAKVREILTRAEARVQEIEARAEARVNHAEDRARAAELKAVAAEGWLRRIEEAAKSQLPRDCIVPIQRAA